MEIQLLETVKLMLESNNGFLAGEGDPKERIKANKEIIKNIEEALNND